ncbi:HpcH/HpaI aldolase/citrate lyase family protein [Sinorhizobium americanum]|uniref:Citrate lyase subunit beta/citryl-CoA lyase n=1 Tax=Sinorhizobium americanum TaxID=194963 RepID=A0A4R2AY57_9HYPH|nr:CoA ester lyase [Sinorhizobium americanum]TCN17972.1 citrate lyase subunit beta/citryl-CoA lyase [Sinorhizobium americanum]
MVMNRIKDVHWRSLLFVPANNARYVEKARTSQADAIILDLEDAVLDLQKTEARSAVQAAAASLNTKSRDVLVRINRPLPLAVRDIEAIVCEDLTAIVVAKSASAEHLALLSEILEEREAALGLSANHTKLLPLIETAGGVARLDEIASFSRVIAIACGDEDLAADLGCDPDSETIVSIKYRLVLAAALRGIRPLGLLGSIAEFRDIDKFCSSVARSNAAGLKGTLCIHPDQVTVANEGFAPSKEQLTWARRVVEAAEGARENGAGAVGLDGKMIDAPVLRRAENILAAGGYQDYKGDAERDRPVGAKP